MVATVWVALPALGAETAKSAIWQAYDRAVKFDSDELNRLVYNTSIIPQWFGDGARFWYRSDVRKVRQFVVVEADRGLKRPAFDHTRLAAGLAKVAGKPCDEARLPFDAISFGDDGKSVAFVVAGTTYRCDLGTYQCTKTDFGAFRKPPEAAQTPKAAQAPEDGESPDGKWLAFVRDYNVFVRAKGGKDETKLSDNGDAGHQYGDLAWSPDSRRLVAVRTEPGANLEMYRIESCPEGTLRPKLHQEVYALPGDKVDRREVWAFDVAGRKQMRLQADAIDYWGPSELRWRKDGRHFTYEQTDRGYQRVRVTEGDAETGAARTIIDERSKTFVAPMKHYSQYVDEGREIIWMSERDGWCHLYLYDGRTGQVKNQITRGEWVVRGVEQVDEQAREITFRASGREPGEDPYLIRFYRIRFDGTGLVRLTEGNGNHALRFSPDKRWYVDTYSRVDLAPVTKLRRTADGKLVCKLEAGDAADLVKTGWKWPEPFCAKGRDGKTDIWGVLYRPSTLDPHRRYPIIEDIYAGPQGSAVPESFAAHRGSQALAELGFIVVQIDGMGMSERSKAFHDVCYKNLGDSGFPDRIAWMQAAARKYPYMDVSRVGIFGTSAGGYNAAHALIAHPEFYKAAVAISANHDHRTDKLWWNELWMGYPVGKEYAEQSNVTGAAKLQGHLLLLHGEMDDNVYSSASTMQFAAALIKANKDFEMFLVPGAGHGVGGPYFTRKLWDHFVRYLQGVEPPQGYQIKGTGDGSCHITIRNLLQQPVAIYWVDGAGKYTKYHDLAPGQSVSQHTYYGHQWEAQVGGQAVSTFAAEPDEVVWEVR